MKSKLVIWGKNPHGKRVLLAVSLNEQENKVETLVFNEDVVTEELENGILKAWKEQDKMDVQVEHHKILSDLSMLESILPDGYTTDKDDVLKRAQTEWHFIVLSTRLYNVYKSEVDEIREKVEELEAYNQKVWDDLKTFWDKIQVQIYEKNLLRSHAQDLREFTNQLFEALKEKRKSLDKVMNEKSRSLYDQFAAKMEEIEGKIEKGLSLQPVFEDLRKLQKEINDSDLLRDHRKKIWNRIDVSFKKVKEMRFGEASEADRNQIARLENRLQGLDGVIKRMQHTVKLDVRELDRLAKNSDSPFGMLEEQLKSAKRMMVEERLASKQSKLDDMLRTQKELQEKLAKLREKDESKRLIDEAKKMAELKIAEEIKASADQRKDDEEKLVKAAEELKVSRGPKKAKQEEQSVVQSDGADPLIPEEALNAAEKTTEVAHSVENSEEE
jgi:hypothetical protein